MEKKSENPLSWRVAEEIRKLICKNVMVSGERLNEQKLCDQLGVSRTPLREALRMLSAEGLVKITPNKGAFVTEASIEEIFQMFETMSILEGSCARLATERLFDADLDELEKLHEQLEEAFQAGDMQGYMGVNHDYHLFIQEKAGNQVLSKIVSGLRNVILVHRYRQIYTPGRLAESMEEHRRLIEAFRARDGERADRLMRAHLIRQCQALVTHYAEKGQSLENGKRPRVAVAEEDPGHSRRSR